MLVDVKFEELEGSMKAVMSVMAGGNLDEAVPRRIRQGCYYAPIGNFDHFLPHGSVEAFPKFGDLFREEWRSSYGVCDDPEQVLDQYRVVLADSSRRFVISFMEVRRDEQPQEGGWRWHKWGPYIGTKQPEHEYLFDEDPCIDKVFCFHVSEVLSDAVVVP